MEHWRICCPPCGGIEHKQKKHGSKPAAQAREVAASNTPLLALRASIHPMGGETFIHSRTTKLPSLYFHELLILGAACSSALPVRCLTWLEQAARIAAHRPLRSPPASSRQAA